MQINGIEVRHLANCYQTPLYVYDFDRIVANVKRMQTAFSTDDVPVKIYYAMKANSHPAIVSLINSLGIGVDCVSPGEMEIALRMGVPPTDVLFTGNYESSEDLKAAFDAGVLINLDDISSLDRMLRIGKPDRVSFRINPGKGRGRFEQITTAGEKAKFGIPFEKATLAYQRALEAGIKRFGAHIMTGSGILDADHFLTILTRLLDILEAIAVELGIRFEFIDMGGGFGIPYYEDESALDILSLGHQLIELFRERRRHGKLGRPALCIEPGRYLVGDAGYLITKVTGIKESYKKFAGLDAGFNTLIRPALYHAYHPIFVDGKESDSDLRPINLCGQICENTDIFYTDRLLPELAEGDLLIFTQAGAYGNVMAMTYNHRLRPAEIAIKDGQVDEITRRERMEDFWNRITFPYNKSK